MSTFLLAVGVILGVAYIYHHVVVRGKQCTSKAKLHGKTVIVTGRYRFCLLNCCVCHHGGRKSCPLVFFIFIGCVHYITTSANSALKKKSANTAHFIASQSALVAVRLTEPVLILSDCNFG